MTLNTLGNTLRSFTKNWGLRGRKASPAGMDSLLTESFKYLFAKNIVVTLMTLLPSSIEGLMGLWEEQPSSLPSFKGLELGNESPIFSESPTFKWEWFSEPLDCPPNEGCSPEPMVGTMNPLEGNPRPFQGGEEVSKRRLANLNVQ
jgi:hypothetical protein